METNFNCPKCKTLMVCDEDFTELYCNQCNANCDYWDYILSDGEIEMELIKNE